MPVLPNSKHELFAQARAQGQSAAAAFVSAGYAANDSNAARLNGNERVRARVEEIQAAGAERAGLTVDWVLECLRSNHEQAFSNKDGAVANKALELIGKHLGMFKDRVEHSGEVNLTGGLPALVKRVRDAAKQN